MQDPLSSAVDLYADAFGGEPEFFASAPGRINLIGEHTDYNEGFVFPVAIDQSLVVVGSLHSGESWLRSRERGDGQVFDSETIEPEESIRGFSKYVAGMAWAIREKTGLPMPNLKAALSSDIPIGSGVSSSAAIEMAFGVLWNSAAQAGLSNKDLALLGRRCENEFVGLQSGVMDQMASAMGREGFAMFLDTRTLDIEYLPMPDGVTVALCDTGKRRALTSSKYNERRMQCAEACAALGVAALRDADEKLLDGARASMGELVYRRARHVVTENRRCVEFAEALASGDRGQMRRLMREAHVSMRDDFEATGPELDAMAEACWSAPGCVGARMTGGGFGGACVALVETGLLREFTTAASSAYRLSTSLEPGIRACKVVDGAKVLLK